MATELKEVPWLTAEDMCKGKMRGPNDTHCLVGWADLIDPNFQHGIMAAVSNQCWKRDRKGTPASNDAHTNQENVELWHRALASLGWEEGAGYVVI